MINAANQQAYATRYDAYPPGGPPFWHPAGLSRPLGILAMILGFVFWWPVGLAVLFTMKWSGHMGCWGKRQQSMYNNGTWQGPFQGWAPWKNWNTQPQANSTGTTTGTPSGNHAFDEYRAATLRRLEEEQQEFGSFLERLRFAKDKAEFDQFMAERRESPTPPTGPEPHPRA